MKKKKTMKTNDCKSYFRHTLVLFLVIGFISCSKDDPEPQEITSAYISKVYDFMPAVGQFINTMPEYKQGDAKETIIARAEEFVKGENPKGMISLGGFGGYIVFGFDHMIENVAGYRDFKVLGNAFWADANPNPEAPSRGGSCEPGIIMVSYDANNNGLPDDAWYEIAGSEYGRSVKNYEITYYKPDPNKTPVLNEKEFYATDTEYIYWEDNQGNSGYKMKNQYHAQSYYPEWIAGDRITFTGTLLPNNAVDESGEGRYWVQYSFDYGYADNAPNNDDESAIDIDWAVDANGNKANLPGIHFVKVYNGMNQECGWLGETSTEVSGAYDLHLLGISIRTQQ
ncbi:MAG: hypothetical protein AB2L24_16810 [Mangrovibacterium sp.]